jgi:P-type Ca2+ transporter type 2C
MAQSEAGTVTTLSPPQQAGHGLSAGESKRRLADQGPNALPGRAPPRLWVRLLRQFQSALIYILLFALALDLGLWLYDGAEGVPYEAVAIGLILALNAGLGALQESKAEAALARLQALATPLVWVMRDGALLRIPATELVPGDLARIEAGDRVPADGRLTEGQGVMVDESILTGESLPVEKVPGDEIFSGTLAVRSKGLFEITATGPRSSMGRLATMIGGIETSKTPLERRLGQFGNQVAITILSLGVVLTAGGLLVEGIGEMGQVVLFSVALAVAAVPEGLPAVLTLTLAMGVERLAGRKAVVRRLSAVEALGSITVIATDKTGTLTENRMHVRAVDTPDPARALLAMVLANDAEVASEAGDPLETALLTYAAGQGVDPTAAVAARPRRSSRPFDSVAKFMRVTVEENGTPVSYFKGAPEVLIARSALSDSEKQAWESKALKHASEGSRVLALGWREGEGEDRLTIAGLVMLWDPPRPEVPDAIRRARGAGIRVMMITGDHPATARAIAENLGIEVTGVVTGSDLAEAPAARLPEIVRSNSIFARVSPEQKLMIVEALKSAGEIVAVTGDGVNDAPALKRSDVGVAMGLRGSDVAREVADVVLLDDNFATIVAAIEEGRSIYENIQKFVRFFFSTDLALIALMIAGLGLAWLLDMQDPAGGTFLLPLTAAQLLWINVIADGPPALALALDRNPGIMNQPPRPPTSRLLDSASLRFIIVSGVAKALGGLAILAGMPYAGYSLDETRTSVFVYESVTQLVFAYNCRRIGVVPLPNIWVHVAVLSGVALQLGILFFEPTRTLLGLAELDVTALAVAGGAVLITWTIASLPGRSRLRREHGTEPRQGGQQEHRA